MGEGCARATGGRERRQLTLCGCFVLRQSPLILAFSPGRAMREMDAGLVRSIGGRPESTDAVHTPVAAHQMEA